jgi:GNAT superfamily N-acetyltransferase
MPDLQSYIRETAVRGREVERFGPFLATFSRNSGNPFLNYAIPDAGARPSVSDVDALIAAYRKRGLVPRLEFLTESAPDVEAVLTEAGFTLERRVPLMVCPPGALAAPPPADGFDLLTPESDAEFAAMISAQNEAYGEAASATAEAVEHSRDLLNRGGFAMLARDSATGEAAGGVIATALLDGCTELAGLGVRAAYRRRGLGAALSAAITRDAHAQGARTVFLTPAGEPEERMYATIGYRPAGECVHLSLPQAAVTHGAGRRACT